MPLIFLLLTACDSFLGYVVVLHPCKQHSLNKQKQFLFIFFVAATLEWLLVFVFIYYQ